VFLQSCMFQICRAGKECSAAVASLCEACLQDDPKLRPTASEIVCTLEDDWVGLQSHPLAFGREPSVMTADHPACKTLQ
jgi:hypothetical protein